MSADIIQAQYDELEKVAGRFGKQAEVQLALRKTLKTRVERLRGGGWIGKGADAFYAEMDGKVFPALDRLVAALNEAKAVTLQMRALVAAAEEDAARPFRSGPGATDLPDPAVMPIEGERNRWWGLWKETYSYKPPYQPFSGSISPDGISPNDVTQGQIGDCYLLAGLSSIAQQHPEVIWNAIKDNGDGTYTVTLYKDGKPTQVTVDNDFPVRQDANGQPTGTAAYAQHGSQPTELWPMILEKAYTQLQGSDYTKIDGGWPGDAITTLTGKPAEQLNLNVSADKSQTTLQDLQDRLAAGEYLTAGTRSGQASEDMSKWPSNVVPLHAYTVERVDAAAGLIYLRNPWGSAANPAPLTLEEFNKYYNYAAANH